MSLSPKKQPGTKSTVKTAMSQALSASLVAETHSFQSRFERADAVLGQTLANGVTGEVVPGVEKAPNPAPAQVPRVIRDAFTMPEEDYRLIAGAQERCLLNAVRASKSEVLRAGLQALAGMSDEQLTAAIARLSRVPTGRPKAAG